MSLNPDAKDLSFPNKNYYSQGMNITVNQNVNLLG